MSAAAKLLIALLALGACGKEADPAAKAPEAQADVETLPPDESVATPSNQLANGAAEPQGNTADVEP